MHSFRQHSSRSTLTAVALLALAACSDRPATLPLQPVPTGLEGTMLRCTVQVRASTVTCAPRAGAPGVSAVILGGQGTNVRLASSGTSYDAGTSILRSDVTLENLTARALGTSDGVTPAAEGVRVFFATGPAVTEGTGMVSIANADGQGVFTGASQSYFQYGGLLFPGDTTPAKEWRFSLPPTVATFEFTVYVAAAVAHEAGWITVQPIAPMLLAGDTMHLSAVVTAATGRPVPGARVEWSTSNPLVATVDSLGVLTALTAGIVDITATSGARTGRVTAWINTAGSSRSPIFVGFDVLTPSVEVNGTNPVRLRVTMRGFNDPFLTVLLARGSTPGGCGALRTATEPDGDGVFECEAYFIPENAGVWRVTGLTTPLSLRVVTEADLVAAGAPTVLNLRAPAPVVDTTAPSLDWMEIIPDTVRAGIDALRMVAIATDSGVGAVFFRAVFRHPDASGGFACTAAGSQPLFECFLTFPAYVRSGTWTVASAEVRDGSGNRRFLNTAELQAAGFETSVYVQNPDPDLTPPDITGFSFSPASVKGNGVDSVLVTLSASDARSRVWFLDMEFENASASQTRRCLLNAAPQPSMTMTCAQRFSAADAGAWHVRYVRAVDLSGNERVLSTDDLAAGSYPTALTVTPP